MGLLLVVLVEFGLERHHHHVWVFDLVYGAPAAGMLAVADMWGEVQGFLKITQPWSSKKAVIKLFGMF